MTNEDLIKKFYQSFADKDAESMVACYHDDITFQDPAFGILKGSDAKNMWRMLIERGSADTKISVDNIRTKDKDGSADWQAEYKYGPKKRKVINNISARFEFKDGKIIKHTDYFNMWKWTKQALGTSGYLLGWSSYMKRKIQTQTNYLLKKFTENNSG